MSEDTYHLATTRHDGRQFLAIGLTEFRARSRLEKRVNEASAAHHSADFRRYDVREISAEVAYYYRYCGTGDILDESREAEIREEGPEHWDESWREQLSDDLAPKAK